MSNKKQMAVDWLIQKIKNRWYGQIDEFPILTLDEIFKQAREKEKEQIISSYMIGRMKDNTLQFGMEYYNKIEKVAKEAEEQYNTLFKTP